MGDLKSIKAPPSRPPSAVRSRLALPSPCSTRGLSLGRGRAGVMMAVIFLGVKNTIINNATLALLLLAVPCMYTEGESEGAEAVRSGLPASLSSSVHNSLPHPTDNERRRRPRPVCLSINQFVDHNWNKSTLDLFISHLCHCPAAAEQW